jgi:hypothetical protein
MGVKIGLKQAKSKLNTCVMDADAATGRETGWMSTTMRRERH